MATPPNTLLEPVPGYPVFEANQLLSFRDLNEVRDYLDQQTRLTRVWLTGAGIVCGLVPRSNGSSLVVSAGCGVTTEGFLIPLDTCTLTHYQPIKIPHGEFLGTETSPNDLIDAFELFEQASEGRDPLKAELIADKVLVLLLESKDDKNEACLDDCDEKGTQRELKIRKLLIDQAKALTIAQENFNPILDDGQPQFPDWTVNPSDTESFNLFTEQYKLADLYLERFGHTPANASTETPAQANLTTIQSYEIFLERYGTIIAAGSKRLSKALQRTHAAFSPIFSRERPEALPELPTDRFDVEQLKNEYPSVIQYVYDHLADLILAYDEFRSEAFDLMDVCRGQTGWFPKHLFLGVALTPEGEVLPPPSNLRIPDTAQAPVGELPASSSSFRISGTTLTLEGDLPIPPSPLRTPYVQPPVYNGNRTRVNAARLLFQRLATLIHSFKVPDPTKDQELRVTPSRWGDAPLSERAIPYYYQPEKNLHRVWNADRRRKARDHRVHSYFRIGAPENPPYDDPLVFDFEGHDFYRIEGHIGLQERRAFDLIQQLREHYNLAFDLVVLKLGEVNEDDFDHDCEFQLLQVQYTKLRTDLLCALPQQVHMDSVKVQAEPVKNQTDPVKNLLAELVEKLDDFDYKSFEEDFNAVLQSGEQSGTCLLGYDRQAFFDLSELHHARKKEVLKQTLFHEFAKSHPGMEHKGGVPRGGTFVLVYRQHQLTNEERQERLDRLINRIRDQIDEINADVSKALEATIGQTSRTVVADFCLPYLCCSDCPPTAYIVARPRPTLVLVPGAFCADDGEKYQFIVDPPGGILTGLGTRQEGVHYFFVPRDTHLDQGFVDVTYTVDGAEAKLKLAILPIPKATFQLPPRICIDEKLVPLQLDDGTLEGGEFTTDIDESNPKLGIVETADGVSFDPMVDGVPHDEPIHITYIVRDENGCTGSSERTTRVHETPNASFTGLEETYCSDDEPSELTTQVSGGEFTTDIDPDEPHLGIIEEEGVFFDPSAADFNGDQLEMTVTVRHRVTDPETGCQTESTQPTTVFRMPNADFTGLQETYCSNDEPSELTPEVSGGEFTTNIDPNEPHSGISEEEDGIFFDPSAVVFEGNQVEVTVTHRVTNTDTDCQAESTEQTTVFRMPDAGFTGLQESYCSDDDPSELTPEESGGEFTTDIDPADPHRGIIEEEGVFFDPSAVGFDGDQVEVTVTVQHRVTDPETGCQAESPEQTKVILVPPLGEFSIEPLPAGLNTFRFQISDIQPLQSDAGPFQYVFDWENGQSEQPNSKDFVLRIPQQDLPDQDLLTLKLFLRNNQCQGPAVEATSKIIREEEKLDEDDEQIPDELLGLLEQRHAQNLELITKVAESNEGIDDTKSFQLASALVEAAPDQSTEGLVASYDEFVGAVLPVYKRAEDDRKIAYQTLLETATLVLFDRIVTQPGNQAMREQASEQLAKIREAGPDLDVLFQKWLTTELKDALDALEPERIDVVRSLIE